MCIAFALRNIYYVTMLGGSRSAGDRNNEVAAALLRDRGGGCSADSAGKPRRPRGSGDRQEAIATGGGHKQQGLCPAAQR